MTDDTGSTTLPIPASLAFLKDAIFEELPAEKAQDWSLRFRSAIPLGADLLRVTHLFLAWLMDDPTHGVANITTDTEVKEFALEVARRYRTGELLDGPEAEALADRLLDASDAWAAPDAWAASDAWAARDASDAWAAWAAWAAFAAPGARAARDEFVGASADELIRLLAAAPLAVGVAR